MVIEMNFAQKMKVILINFLKAGPGKYNLPPLLLFISCKKEFLNLSTQFSKNFCGLRLKTHWKKYIGISPS